MFYKNVCFYLKFLWWRFDEIHIEGTVVDDRALSQMKIDIHYAGDGHGHGGKTSLEFEYEEILTNFSKCLWTD